jgi:molecular chaperone GrpE
MSNLYDKEELLEDELTQEAEKSAAEYETQEDIIEEYQEEISQDENKITKLQDALARSQADFDNFKKRTQRDKDDMIFFLKADIFKKILPRLDDLERIIKNTPEKMQDGAVYQGVVTLQKTLLKDLNKL